jgi:inorganic triphosphatase YgiF
VTDTLERELKLVPEDAALLDALAMKERLGPFEVRDRHDESQRNSFFDSASRGLSAARVGFRRRVIQGQPRATWTIKGDSTMLGGVASRTEIELQLDADTPPAMALDVLRAAARSRGATPLAEAVASGGMPLAQPYLETATDRTVVDLEAPLQGWRIELALDRTRIVGHDFAEIEIEAELKRGDLAALDVVREAISAMGAVRESRQSKLARAMAHLESCDGCGQRLSG